MASFTSLQILIMPTQEVPLIPGEIADYQWEESGILVSHSKPIRRTVANISNNAALVKQITKGQKVPLLIFLSSSPIPDKATRQLSAKLVPELYTAMAMVAAPGLASLVMSMVFRLRQPPIPMRSFTSEKKARTWLKSLGS